MSSARRQTCFFLLPDEKRKKCSISGMTGAIALILGLWIVQVVSGLQLIVSNFKYIIYISYLTLKFFIIFKFFEGMLTNSAPKGRLAIGSKVGNLCGNPSENVLLSNLNNLFLNLFLKFMKFTSNLNNLIKCHNVSLLLFTISYVYRVSCNLLHTYVCKHSKFSCMYWLFAKHRNICRLTCNLLHTQVCKCSRLFCMYWHTLYAKCHRWFHSYSYRTPATSHGFYSLLIIKLCESHFKYFSNLNLNFILIFEFLHMQKLNPSKRPLKLLSRTLNPTKCCLNSIIITCSKVKFFQNIFKFHVETCIKACGPKWSLVIRGKQKKGALLLRSLTFAPSNFFPESWQIALLFSKKQANSENISCQISHKNRFSFPQSEDYSVRLIKICQIMIMIMIRSDSWMKVLANSKIYLYKSNFNFKLILFNSKTARSKKFLKHLFFILNLIVI